MSDLEQLASLVGKLQKSQEGESSKKLAAFEGLLTEISTALSDIVSCMEADAKEDKSEGDSEAKMIADALTAAIADLAVTVNSPITVNVPKQDAPTISVNVSPTPVTVTCPEMPTPIVNIEGPKEWTELVADSFAYGRTGQLESFRVRRI